MDQKELGMAIRDAIKQGDADKVVALIGSDRTRLQMMTPFGTWLHVAAAKGKVNIVKRLVEMGAEINVRAGIEGGAPVNLAAAEGHIEIVEYLLSRGAELDVSEPERNPLFSAIQGGHTEVARLLIDSGIDTTATYTGENMKNMDALAFARQWGRNDIVELLSTSEAGPRTIRQSLVDEVVAHFGRLFGPPDPQALQKIVPVGWPPIAVHVIPRTREHNSVTMFTTGMSSAPMKVPAGNESFQYAELFIQLPGDWNYKATDDLNNAWPHHWLRSVARYPHENHTWLGGPFTIIANGDPPEPLAPNVTFTSVLLLADRELKTSAGQIVQVYRMLPLYTEERRLEQRRGIRALLEALQRQNIPLVIDPNRHNVGK